MTKIQKDLQRKQQRQYLSKKLIGLLLDQNPKSYLRKAYKTSIKLCSNVLSKDDNKLNGFYCKHRFCITCRTIRQAQVIEAYLPYVCEMKDPRLVTLTRPVTHHDYLKEGIDDFYSIWRAIYKLSKKAKYKREYNHFKGFIALEVEPSKSRKDHYNIHYHITIEGLKQARWLKSQWLKRNPEASPRAQNIRKITNTLGSMKEIFKYSTKMTSSKNHKVDYVRLDYILTHLKGRRLFRAFGGYKQIKDDLDETALVSVHELELASSTFEWYVDDWYGLEYGEALVNREIPERIKNKVR